MLTHGSILFRTLMLLLHVEPQCCRLASTVYYPVVTYPKPITLFDVPKVCLQYLAMFLLLDQTLVPEDLHTCFFIHKIRVMRVPTL